MKFTKREEEEEEEKKPPIQENHTKLLQLDKSVPKL